MLTPDDFGLSGEHYSIRDRHLVEAMPGLCPSGHSLGRDTVLIGNHPCVKCTGFSHRTWRCRECDSCWIWPACADRPQWPEWPGIDDPDLFQDNGTPTSPTLVPGVQAPPPTTNPDTTVRQSRANLG